MKLRTMVLICALALSAAFTAHADTGDVTGSVYSTDILTYIDGVPIKSYNIGGKTAVELESLREYGFDVVWNEEDRTLRVEAVGRPEQTPASVERGAGGGAAIGSIYETDISVYYHDIKLTVPTYNIGGITCAAVEDLGAFRSGAADEKVYSDFGMYYTYDDDARELRLYTLHPGDVIDTDYGAAEIIGLTPSFQRDCYSYNGDGEMHIAYSVNRLYGNEIWDFCVNPADIAAVSAETDGGIYSITAENGTAVAYRRMTASNGGIHNSSLALKLAMPMKINGVLTEPTGANCIMLCGVTREEFVPYVSAGFLQECAGIEFTEE